MIVCICIIAAIVTLATSVSAQTSKDQLSVYVYGTTYGKEIVKKASTYDNNVILIDEKYKEIIDNLVCENYSSLQFIHDPERFILTFSSKTHTNGCVKFNYRPPGKYTLIVWRSTALLVKQEIDITA